jgi:maltodextrin utilization protein YvdJ
MIPIAGGFAQQTVQSLSDAHAAKVDAQKQMEAGNAEAAAYALQVQQANLQNAGQTVGTMVSPTVSAFTKGLIDETYANVSTGAKQSLAKAGASVADLTIQEWFKSHLKHILIGAGVLVSCIIAWKTLFKAKPQVSYKKR